MKAMNSDRHRTPHTASIERGRRAMAPEQSKARREMHVFLEFIRQSQFTIDGAPEGRSPPEPEILCKHQEQGFIAFELVELCDAQIAGTTARMTRSKTCSEPVFRWTADPTTAVIRSKLEKIYQTDHPIELLCYSDGRLVTPDDVIIPTVRQIIAAQGFGMFRRVWLLGEKSCEVISERPL